MKNDTTLQLANENAPCTLEIVTDGVQSNTAPTDDTPTSRLFSIMPSFLPTAKDQTRYLNAIENAKSFMQKFGGGRQPHTHYNYYANRTSVPIGTQRIHKEWVTIAELEQIGLSRNLIGSRLSKAAKDNIITREREGKHYIYKYSDVLLLLSDYERIKMGI